MTRLAPPLGLAAVAHVGQIIFRARDWIAPIALLALALFAGRGPFLMSAELDGILDFGGMLLILAGLTTRLAVIGAVDIRRSGSHRHIAAPRLHDVGPYGCCRHPLYLGNAMILFGVALVYDSPWMLLAALPVTLLGIGAMIVAEERLLSRRFGDAYRHYAARVPRFALRGLVTAVRQASWSWRRAVRKEHGPIFAAGTTVFVLFLVERIGRDGILSWHAIPRGLVIAWTILAGCYAGVRYLKRAGHLSSIAAGTPGDLDI